MGQRLVFTVRFGDDKLANCYMHWSAYTGASIETTNMFLDALDNFRSENPGILEKAFGDASPEGDGTRRDLIVAIMMKAWPGSQPAVNEIDGVPELPEDEDPDGTIRRTNLKMFMLGKGMFRTASMLENTPKYDRNDGIISFTEDTMEKKQSWSEGDVEVYLKEDGIVQEIYFGVVFGDEYQSALDYAMEGDEDMTEEKFKDDLYETDHYDYPDCMTMSLEGWSQFVADYDEARTQGKYSMGSAKSGYVIQFIE